MSKNTFRFFFMIFLFSSLAHNSFAALLSSIELQKSEYLIEYNEEDLDNLQNKNIDLSLEISNNELQPYKLAVILDAPFSRDAFQIVINLPSNSVEEGILLDSDTLIPDDMETIFYVNNDPQFETQPFSMSFDVLIPENLNTGTYEASLRFILYQEDNYGETTENEATPDENELFLLSDKDIIVAETEALIQVQVSQIFKMIVNFNSSKETVEAGNNAINNLDFGLIDSDTLFKDQKIEIHC